MSFESKEIKKSVVQVYFPVRNLTCAYYNDSFDLHQGDIVYVDGKLEGLRGKVVSVSYTFKIKLSDYKRVICKADTDIKGELFTSYSHFLSFDKSAIPFEKIVTWYKAPDLPDEEYACGSDNTSFALDDFKNMKIDFDIIENGYDYYTDNNVVYLCLDGVNGRAIVQGKKAYEVEFTYNDGEISNLTCGCYCSNICKHEYAVILQLREALKSIEEDYSEQYKKSNYFASIDKEDLLKFTLFGRKNGRIYLG